MKTWELSYNVAIWESPSLPAKMSLLHLVSVHEVLDLKRALTHGRLPADFEDKLQKLAKGDLLRSSVELHCRVFIELLKAAGGGHFREASPADIERLLRVLAYVRKDEDAIPDYKPNGFTDDLQEVRAAARDLAPSLHAFKSWRLRHQVPAMWCFN